jgi:hypothetical protein
MIRLFYFLFHPATCSFTRFTATSVCSYALVQWILDHVSKFPVWELLGRLMNLNVIILPLLLHVTWLDK